MNLITLDTFIGWNHAAFVFCDYLHLAVLESVLHIVAHVTRFPFFLRLVTLHCMCIYTHIWIDTPHLVNLKFHLLVDIWVASSFSILWIAWLWTWVYTYLFENPAQFFWIHTWLLDLMVILFLSNCYTVFHSDDTIYLHSNQQGTRSSTFSHHQQYVLFFNSSLRSVRWSHYGFDLHFSNS